MWGTPSSYGRVSALGSLMKSLAMLFYLPLSKTTSFNFQYALFCSYLKALVLIVVALGDGILTKGVSEFFKVFKLTSCLVKED